MQSRISFTIHQPDLIHGLIPLICLDFSQGEVTENTEQQSQSISIV